MAPSRLLTAASLRIEVEDRGLVLLEFLAHGALAELAVPNSCCCCSICSRCDLQLAGQRGQSLRFRRPATSLEGSTLGFEPARSAAKVSICSAICASCWVAYSCR